MLQEGYRLDIIFALDFLGSFKRSLGTIELLMIDYLALSKPSFIKLPIRSSSVGSWFSVSSQNISSRIWIAVFWLLQSSSSSLVDIFGSSGHGGITVDGFTGLGVFGTKYIFTSCRISGDFGVSRT